MPLRMKQVLDQLSSYNKIANLHLLNELFDISLWLSQMLKRKSKMLVTIALVDEI